MLLVPRGISPRSKLYHEELLQMLPWILTRHAPKRKKARMPIPYGISSCSYQRERKRKREREGEGKGGKQPPSADVSEAFKAHKLAQQAKRESFKRQMDADLAVRRSKKPKSG